MSIPTSHELFDSQRVAVPLRPLLDVVQPWQILQQMDAFLETFQPAIVGEVHPSAVIQGAVYLAEGARVGAHACIEGPAWIGAGASVGHAAYVRGGSVLAEGAKVGHSSEVKHSLLLQGAKAAHFNYIGDSVVGSEANVGAGVKLANFHALGQPIKVAGVATGLRKFSAAIGDDVSIGCNAVISPGTLIGRQSIIYSSTLVRGVIPAGSMVKLRQVQEVVPRRDLMQGS